MPDESVVSLWLQESVAVVTMADLAGRNTFVPRLTEGLVAAVSRAARQPTTKVVLVEGLPELFCAGGTREELLGFADGTSGSFADADFYRVFARCPVPVVAAVQGHALGGGLALALYADMLVLSERSVYAATFMRYGFTPGMGATYLLPSRFGPGLGSEMLYTARNYHGSELRQRGVLFPVVAHSEVPVVARRLARQVASAPRSSLELLKAKLAKPLIEGTDAAIAEESRMHQVSFRLPEVAGRIASIYGGAQ